MTRVPQAHCLNCKHSLNMATTIAEDYLPEPGNCAVCLYCGHLMVLTEELTLREPNDDEMRELIADPAILEIMQFREQFEKWKMKHEDQTNPPPAHRFHDD